MSSGARATTTIISEFHFIKKIHHELRELLVYRVEKRPHDGGPVFLNSMPDKKYGAQGHQYP